MKAKRKPATKAKRKTAAKAKPAQMDPHAEFRRQLGVAFQDQECAICDLLIMATITDDLNDKEQQGFAVGVLRDLIERFKKRWYDDIARAQFKPAAVS